MRKFHVKVTGVTPYMQHRMDTQKLKDWELNRGKIIEREGLNTEPEKIALFHSYITDDGFFYIPSTHFKQCFVKGGSFVKSKVGNASRSMKNIVAGMWRIEPDKIPFRRFDEVYTTTAVNHNNNARIVTHRPMWKDWSCEFNLLVDDDGLLTQNIIESIISYGGRYLGVGSYRPEHTGEFGRFFATVEEVCDTNNKPKEKKVKEESVTA